MTNLILISQVRGEHGSERAKTDYVYRVDTNRTQILLLECFARAGISLLARSSLSKEKKNPSGGLNFYSRK